MANIIISPVTTELNHEKSKMGWKWEEKQSFFFKYPVADAFIF